MATPSGKTLRERLDAVAEHAPRAVPEPGLWERAARFNRRVRIGWSVTVAGCLIMLGSAVLVLDASNPRHSAPADGSTVLALPDRLPDPSPWLEGTDDGDPVEVVAAVLTGVRKSLFGSNDDAYVAVSAIDGSYRFLDLPNRAAGSGVALSPDGRHLAYWVTGGGVQQIDEDESEPVVGIALFDFGTHQVVWRVDVPTEFGLATDGLHWGSDDELIAIYGQNGGPSQPGAMLDIQAWAYSLAGESRSLGDMPVDSVVGAGLLMGSVYEPSNGFVVRRSDTGAEVARFSAGETGLSRPLPSPDLKKIAHIWNGLNGNAMNPNRLTAGPMPADGGEADLAKLSGPPDVQRIVAWIDANHVAVVARVPEGDAQSRLLSVDVRTGARETRTVGSDGSHFGAVQFATDLLDAGSVDRPEPASPWNGRMTTALLAVIALAATCTLVRFARWRRRVRP